MGGSLVNLRRDQKLIKSKVAAYSIVVCALMRGGTLTNDLGCVSVQRGVQRGVQRCILRCTYVVHTLYKRCTAARARA